ncbi:hypothetical protein F441_06409 [Phytophthora nicotianae CJ01A1]|uniref:Uncharacterized protein n=3 Tax=Phytophthora nicotianae TaxID=4792 RepID=V9FHQ6_PHYNI|nr:hypothetical protein F443_06401 [Phytophthora nicotianae P1569]ETK89810.1 hypothetical protein L915_06287 [Phytophthora nicotianae]ETP19700.1 hypothetical protein F441_06409 [Phytophthora nicotianae CJ01A1]ETL43209.1 hypothetical protein L916_06224 [Phytophthora nicotianae]ETL96399.1 hypothetical protein L917_06096 [Phytophthora nicotianae]
MVRLGLSDSMRSTVSIEDTEPLHTASHRRTPRRLHSASTATPTDASNKQRMESKTSSFVLSNSLRILLGGVLAIVLLSTGIKVLNMAVRISRISNAGTRTQFERLERSIELLSRDTTRLQTTADSFLQSCQEAQVAASTRTEMLQNAANSRFKEQTKTQIEEHEQIMKEVMQYYAQQERQVLEARERLMKMNVTLPVQMAARPATETWQQVEQGGDVVELGGARDRLAEAMEGLELFAKKTLLDEGDDYQRLSLESISIQRTEEFESSRQMREDTSSSYGSLVFYSLVVCTSAIYLWYAVLDTRKKELLEDKWAWSPVPTILTRLRALLGSVVVIEDLQPPNNKDDDAYSS